MPDRSAAIAEANPASSGATAAQASASARRAAPEPTGEAPAAAPALRQRLGQKGPYTLNKLIRRQADGTEQLICFELMRDGKPIKRGTQAQVRETLQALLAKPG
jgi:hypothetical protein